MQLIEQILDISRQNRIGELSPWFLARLEEQIKQGKFLTVEQLEEVRERIVNWLVQYREQTGVKTAAGYVEKTVVLGMSGGVDSACTAALFKEAGWRVIGFVMPIHQDPVETARGVEACVALGIEYHTIDLSALFDQTVAQLTVAHDSNLKDGVDKTDKIRRGNIRARLRMVTLYNMANLYRAVVASTDNFSELAAGFWTLHGDVGDVSPIQGLNKSWEVPMMAKLVGVPEATWRATPTDGLGIDAGDEAQLGASYLEWDIMFNELSKASAVENLRGQAGLDCVTDRICNTNDAFDDRAAMVRSNVLGRIGGTWFKRLNPANFEHPVLRNIENLNRIDSDIFRPEVVR